MHAIPRSIPIILNVAIVQSAAVTANGMEDFRMAMGAETLQAPVKIVPPKVSVVSAKAIEEPKEMGLPKREIPMKKGIGDLNTKGTNAEKEVAKPKASSTKTEEVGNEKPVPQDRVGPEGDAVAHAVVIRADADTALGKASIKNAQAMPHVELKSDATSSILHGPDLTKSEATGTSIPLSHEADRTDRNGVSLSDSHVVAGLASESQGAIVAFASPVIPRDGLMASGTAMPVVAGVRGSSAELQVSSYEASTPNRIEVGLSGGAMGWLHVRAEVNGGGEVHAYLRGSSVSAEGVLHAQSGQMQMYLSGQQVAVHGLHVEPARGVSRGESLMSGGDARQEKGEDARTERKARSSTPTEGEVYDKAMPLESVLGGCPAATGGWLSVRV